MMKTHPISLAFIGPHQSLEPHFREHYFESSLRQVRISLFVAVIFLAAYGVIDYLVVPDKRHLFWAIRFGIACPTGLALLGFTFTRYARRYLQPMLGAGTFIVGMAFIAMIILAPIGKQYVYLFGLIQTQFFIYTFLRLRFIWASLPFGLLILFHAVGTAMSINFPQDRYISDVAFLAGINIMGMLACYAIEYYTRKNFFLARQLKSKKRRLDMVNQLLEKRVEKRTAELIYSNQLLEAEIKERQSVEKALQESSIRYQSMVDNMTDYMVVHNLDGVVVEANYRVIAELNYNPSEIMGKNIKELIVPEQRPDFDDYYLNRLAVGKKVAGQVTFIAKDGDKRQMSFSSIKALQADGCEMVYCLARDITERQRTEKALAESQARFKDIFETAAAGMVIVHSESRKIVEANPAAAQMIGLRLQEIKDRPIDQLIRDPRSNWLLLDEHHAVNPMECSVVTKEGTAITVLKTMRPMEFNGEAHWIISFVSMQKVKEAEWAKRNAERQMHQAQHLQAIGTLAGGIAHDFNNILYGIIGYSELSLDEAPEGSLLRDNLNEILQGSQRAKELVAQILAFSRQGDTEKKPIQPPPLIKEALKLIRASLPATIEIQSDIGPPAETIIANPTQIHQVVMNLCTNAAHAMPPEGGMIKVSLMSETISVEQAGPHGTIAPGEYVKLMVSDNGAGIPERVRNRIFEPFFTTKPQGEGTGMGLAVVLGVVQAHAGGIRVHSEPGEGSRFEILLPVAPGEEQVEEAGEAPPPGGSERILFVDDESSIIHMGKRMLSKLGYDVTTCLGPSEALEIFQKAPEAFDLVITDLTMPTMKGTDLARILLQMRPDLPVILCTGYGDQITTEQIHKIGIREMLVKPILRYNLAISIRQALGMN